MKKKVVIFFIFFSLFFIQPSFVHSVNQQEKGENLWSWIINSLSRLLGAQISHVTNNQDPSVLDKTQFLTDYTSTYQDEANRATPESLKRYYKGVWFYEVLTTNRFGKNRKTEKLQIDDKTVCPNDITLSDLICFYKKNDEKIIYKRENKQPIDYDDDTLIDKLDCQALNNPDICYQNLYINYQDIPRGFFEGVENAAQPPSNQLNNTLRYTLPKNGQGQTVPPTNDKSEYAEIIALDSDKQENFKILGKLPLSSHYKIPCVSNDTDNKIDEVKDTNKKYLRETWKNWIIPKSWQKNSLPSGIDLTKPDMPSFLAYCEGKKAINETFNAGYSQYGALGMAMLGIKYQKILENYFGDIYSVKKIPNFSTKYYQVKVNLVDHWENENGENGNNIDTPEHTKEKYQNCLKLAKSYPDEIKSEIINIAQAESKVGWQQSEDPSYDCVNKWPGTEDEFDSKSKSEQKSWVESIKKEVTI